ncbi:DUF423 domain-containing protein [Spongiibacter sp. KMU-158]|uniref:DUF423 domain-containing protein n=1 Tax=Spongiibacter pelagi TaxID=2760804 RepID=A0A927BYD3_9GAMM|nr:DUF423 domain-containing protein [Spongiibacter pelagi]MBD2857833.1 DUF423 domain-containing protein [Spongiibacter pelagi]
MPQFAIPLAAIFGFLAVALGAFGAHGLKSQLTPAMLEVYQTGVQYHFFHALALLLLGVLLRQGMNHSGLTAAAWLFSIGIVIFSGSLYALAITEIKILGAITPIGGLLFLAGWLCLAYGSWKAA